MGTAPPFRKGAKRGYEARRPPLYRWNDVATTVLTKLGH
jgi:hypothetical protein